MTSLTQSNRGNIHISLGCERIIQTVKKGIHWYSYKGSRWIRNQDCTITQWTYSFYLHLHHHHRLKSCLLAFIQINNTMMNKYVYILTVIFIRIFRFRRCVKVHTRSNWRVLHPDHLSSCRQGDDLEIPEETYKQVLRSGGPKNSTDLNMK